MADAVLARYERVLQSLRDEHEDLIRRDPPKKRSPESGHMLYCKEEPCRAAWLISFLERNRPEAPEVKLERVTCALDEADEYGGREDQYPVLARAAIAAYEDVPSPPAEAVGQ